MGKKSKRVKAPAVPYMPIVPTYDPEFVPTAITPAMRRMQSFDCFQDMIKDGVMKSWTPGFKGQHMSSRWVLVDDSEDTLTSTSATDRDWNSLFQAHGMKAFFKLKAIMNEMDSESDDGEYKDVCDWAIDAQEKNLQNPTTFYAPSAAELRALKSNPDVFVKVCLQPPGEIAERMWVIVHEVEEVRGGRIRGELNNQPLFPQLKCGSLIEFKQSHIYQISTPDQMEAVAQVHRVTRPHRYT